MESGRLSERTLTNLFTTFLQMSSHSAHVKPKARKKLPPTYSRSLSASECDVIIMHLLVVFLNKVYFRIARNIGNFETWSTYQGCEQVSYSDIPEDLGQDVTEVFDLSSKLPIAWTQKVQFDAIAFKRTLISNLCH